MKSHIFIKLSSDKDIERLTEFLYIVLAEQQKKNREIFIEITSFGGEDITL